MASRSLATMASRRAAQTSGLRTLLRSTPTARTLAPLATLAAAQPALGRRLLSSAAVDDGSHSDFKAKLKTNESSSDEEAEIQKWIDDAVKANPVLLFMKGSPEAPQCGFSRRTVNILKQLGANFASADVLASPEVREGAKVYASWPTFPQLYIGGEFVGGCDIVTDMFDKGELKEQLEKVGALKPKAKPAA